MQREEGMDVDVMVGLLKPLLDDHTKLEEMGQAALSRGRPNAATAFVGDLLDLSGESTRFLSEGGAVS